ncbi:hypothetical protein Desaci_1196 [Desulfosporosinus acidiphilus SJ4]|uniref:Uncharacterized protein n=1 Tax=Desulfosporosinus acidiphilus (strain DSM 22704 / JCM 16185 / SJ4) TaxID=646529 RepID=I4D354_DESAJ|nr:hypothetical protein [Desulfosporosinus acidiphilus]AFM40228.1 hypothetical protein Desaci_1196 [Desulfosporosinus acidiphilus SJ4]
MDDYFNFDIIGLNSNYILDPQAGVIKVCKSYNRLTNKTYDIKDLTPTSGFPETMTGVLILRKILEVTWGFSLHKMTEHIGARSF